MFFNLSVKTTYVLSKNHKKFYHFTNYKLLGAMTEMKEKKKYLHSMPKFISILVYFSISKTDININQSI